MARTPKSDSRADSRTSSRKTLSSKSAKALSGKGNFHIEFKNQAQGLAWAAFKQHDVLFLSGPAGTGKALTMESKLYTRTGPIKMREIKIGDEIANPDGSFSKVTGIYPQGKKQVCRVHFSDETFVDCCEEHLWEVSNNDNGWKRVVDTKYIEKNCRKHNGKRLLSVKCTSPVNFDRKEFFISPYTMGVLIAEGNFTNSNVCFSSSETEMVKSVVSGLDANYVVKTSVHNGSFDHRIVKLNKNNKPNQYKEELKNMGMWGKYSYEKFIPENYLYGAVDQRISLLQGLMDGDGTVEKTGSMSYSTTSYKLSQDFCQLVYSLGGTTRIKIKEGSLRDNGERHRVSYRCYVCLPNEINAFLLSRKNRMKKMRSKYFPKKYIDRVERIDFQEMQCISVDHKDSLYLTDNFIVTHNTHLACAFAIEQVLSNQKKKIIMTRPVVEAGESLGFLPGTFEEKINPYMLPMYDCMDKLVGKEGPWRDKINFAMEAAPLAYMRGRSLKNTELIPTPTGMKPMGEIKIGDYVIGSNGTPTKVIGVYPQGELPIYEVRFSDKTTSVCSGDHLWDTMTLNEKRHNKGYTTKNTLEIKETLKNKHNQKIHRIPMISGPVQFESCEVQVDPYLLGVLLGDGHIRKGAVRISSVDEEILTECEQRIPNGLLLKKRNGCDYAIVSEDKNNQLLKSLYDLKLVGSKSDTKFVPENYKFNSVNVRLSILQGLLDTDGWICKHRSGNCRIQYCSTSKTLAEDVMFLVRSLGGYACCNKRDFDESDSHLHKKHVIKHTKSSYIVDIVMPTNPFKLDRKAKQYVNNRNPAKLICAIESIGVAECTCIQVEAEDHLYLTNDFVVTHNTFDDAICIFDEAQNASMMQLKLFMTRFGENSKLIITGDPTQSDLGGNVALVNVMQRLHSVDGIGVVEFKPSQIVRHPLISKIIEKLED